MAIVKFAAPISGLRGTVGGLIYSANGSGPYVKAYAKPPNPRTPLQTRQRANLGSLPAGWQALTPTQKTDWNTFAALPAQDLINALGETYSISGWLWYVKTNLRLDRTGQTRNVTEPTQARPAAPTISAFRVTEAGADPTLTVGGTPVASTFQAGFPAANAFDGITTSGNAWRTANGNVTGFIQYIFPAAITPLKYRIFGRDANATQNPKDWTFEFFNGVTFTVVQTVTNASFPIGSFLDFFLPTPTLATIWQVNISLNNGNATTVGLAELEITAAVADGSCIVYPDGEFDSSPDFSLVDHCAMGNTIGRQVQFPGFYEQLATSSPGRVSESLQAPLTTTFGEIQPNRSWFTELSRQTSQGIRSAASTARTET